MGKLRHLLSTLLITGTILTTCALAQNNLTQIRDTIYNANGTPFNGTVVITWNGYSTTVSGTISPLSTSARIYNGALSVLLVPTTTAAAGSYYQVVYASSDGTAMWTETWQVPPSGNALSVSGVRTSSTTGTGTGTGTGSGSGSGTGTGSTQYATLPIAMSQVTGLTAGLNTINTAATTLSNSLNTLTTTVAGNTSTLSTLSATVTSLSNTVAALPSGSSGSISVAFVDGEVPSGTLNGTNTNFTLSAAPVPAASLELYRNGIVQASGTDYSLSSNTITFLAAGVPRAGDVLEAYYRVTGTTTPIPSFADSEIPGGTINGANTSFTLANSPSPVLSLRLYKNGMLLQQNADYTLSGANITFANGAVPQNGDSLLASYRH